MEGRLSSQAGPIATSSGPGFQNMIDKALSQANARLASLKKAHNHLLQRYTELEIKYIELQASQELSFHHSSTTQSHGYSQFGERDMASDGEPQQQNGRSIHHYQQQQQQQQQQYHPSDDSMSPHSSFSDSSNGGGGGGGGGGGVGGAGAGPGGKYSGLREFGSGTGGSNYPPKYSAATGMSPELLPPPSRQEYRDHDQPPPHRLRHRPSVPDSIAMTTLTVNSGPGSDDARSMRTVRSATSSEKRKEKIKPQSEIRIRGRGGESPVQ